MRLILLFGQRFSYLDLSSFQSLLSGGVDSTICTVLLHKALSPDQIIAVHIDNGFMRKDESVKVAQSLRNFGLSLTGKTKFVLF